MKAITARQHLAATVLGGLLANAKLTDVVNAKFPTTDDITDWYIRASFRAADRILAEPLKKARATKKR